MILIRGTDKVIIRRIHKNPQIRFTSAGRFSIYKFFR